MGLILGVALMIIWFCSIIIPEEKEISKKEGYELGLSSIGVIDSIAWKIDTSTAADSIIPIVRIYPKK